MEPLQWGMIGMGGEWVSQKVIMKRNDHPLYSQALLCYTIPGLLLQQFSGDVYYRVVDLSNTVSPFVTQ